MAPEFEIVIGLEVHVELATASKIFCSCPTRFGGAPNAQVCPVCLGLPGTLPVLNHQVLMLAVRAGLAINCTIAERTKFDRKNYFYPDLPKAYQISQFDLPLATRGQVIIDTPAGEKKIGITRLHLEEDAGKLVHLSQDGQIGTAGSSLVDYNRTGVPLIEIVSEPDLRSPEEAYAYLVALKEILRYSQVSDCNMEEGSLRCDANISIRRLGQEALGTRAEVKNMNSFKHVREALAYEARRQIKLVGGGGAVIQETRLWDAEHGTTHPMRSKEEADDYRYFPEPDLPLVRITADVVAEVTKELPELPRERRRRFTRTYGLSDYDAGVLTQSWELADYFESAVESAEGAAPKIISNWITVELLGKLNADYFEITQSPVSALQVGRLAAQIENGTISGKMGKDVFTEMYNSGKAPEIIIKEKGLAQISDPEALGRLVETVLEQHPGPVQEYQKGKTQAIGFLVGQVMKSSKGQANPQLVNQLLKERLG